MNQESAGCPEQQDISQTRAIHAGSAWEVFFTFLKLGLTSFGGPIAHLAYFRKEIVDRRGWVSENQYAQLLALCQFLPGPASSQLGFSLGLLRAGWVGALAAFIAFTLPSALLLFAFATLFPKISGNIGEAAIHGLKLVALPVVAQGVLGMSRQLCPDITRAMVAVFAAAVVLMFGQAWVQLLVIALGAVAGITCCRDARSISCAILQLRHGPVLGWILIVVFGMLLFGLPLAAAYGDSSLLAISNAFYRAGALVFGGGHIVLPLLQDGVVLPGWVSPDEFLAGYGAAQAVPGPMFAVAAYLGASMPGGDGGVVGASVALAAIFLPGFLLVAGVLPLWAAITHLPVAARAISGVNAAVVGLLGAALYDPVWVSTVRGPLDLAIAIMGFVLLVVWRVSAFFVVIWCVAASIISAILMR